MPGVWPPRRVTMPPAEERARLLILPIVELITQALADKEPLQAECDRKEAVIRDLKQQLRRFTKMEQWITAELTDLVAMRNRLTRERNHWHSEAGRTARALEAKLHRAEARAAAAEAELARRNNAV